MQFESIRVISTDILHLNYSLNAILVFVLFIYLKRNNQQFKGSQRNKEGSGFLYNRYSD